VPMPPKKSTPPPIDRPLSKAYLRQFTGWSTAFPPGLSEPNSLRLMENMMVDRNGALAVRPGLRLLTYDGAPDIDPNQHGQPGWSHGYPVLSAYEVFYTADGKQALLYAVRLPSGEVGFRAYLPSGTERNVFLLDEPEIGISFPHGGEHLPFSSKTSHVTFLQIDNKILALSDAGEEARYFDVGPAKIAMLLNGVSVPLWDFTHAPMVYHPDAAWIDRQTLFTRRNLLLNPTFNMGLKYWNLSSNARAETVIDPDRGAVLSIETVPLRTNMQPHPLHNVSETGTTGWSMYIGDATISSEHGYLRLTKEADSLARASTRIEDLHLVQGPRILEGVEGGEKYRLAFDLDVPEGTRAVAVLGFYTSNGALITPNQFIHCESRIYRHVTRPITAPVGAATARVAFGFYCPPGESAKMGVRNVLVCKNGEPTSMFSGSSGIDYYWSGKTGESASLYHPRQDITLTSDVVPVRALTGIHGSLTLSPATAISLTRYPATLAVELRNRNGSFVLGDDISWNHVIGSWSRWYASVPPGEVWKRAGARLVFTAKGIHRGIRIQVDEAMIESTSASELESYFDGSTQSAGPAIYSWEDPTRPHESPSLMRVYASPQISPSRETPTADTLVCSDDTKNTNKIAFFYTFENEIGESAPSMITEIRVQRAWSNWLMKRPDGTGKPTFDTEDPRLAADQLLVFTSSSAYNQAVVEGALRWNLYALAWTDQDPVPAEGQLIGTVEIHPDPTTYPTGLDWDHGGWFRVTPQRTAASYNMLLPTRELRENYSDPPKHINGIVAADRMVLVGDPDNYATIAWSSKEPGSFMNFSASRGGGRKTLSSGNLNKPVAIQLWQNPQSVDTLTIMCDSDSGQYTCYYMAPAEVAQGGSGRMIVMGFEETTNSPGSVAPFGAEVLNTALYRPLDTALVKSTAANYNINHKTMTDKIANMWQMLRSKRWISSAQLDNRLYYLVHNPAGQILEADCIGNEIWVFDAAAEAGSWSRFLIQGSALHRISIGPRTYMGVSRNDGIYYLDPLYRHDDYIDDALKVRQKPIPWKCETNTQGANRAHDAWAHLQQIGINLGDFLGSIRYGIRGLDANGRVVNMSKVFTDDDIYLIEAQPRDVEDYLQIRRDMKEWFFYAESVQGRDGTGSISLVQYRYTPVSVNIGYEFGSVETFEYGSDSRYAENGIPRPYIDYNNP
jgi:hypothetical protein